MTRKNKVYTGEFKIEVVEYMQKHGLSGESAAKQFGIKSHTQPENWLHIYLEEGAEGLLIERRGRGKGGKRGRPRKLGAKVEEDLHDEVMRLRMENEYLKKFNALVREKEKSAREKKHK